MKSHLLFNPLLSLSLLFIACKKEEEAAVTSSETPKEIIVPRVQPIPDQTYVQPMAQNTAVPQNQMGAPVAINQPQAVTKPGMNPPHGQAGHRCDIPVGASLSSPVKALPKAGATITQQTIPTPTTTSISQPAGAPALLKGDTQVTAPGMNPPHGQPGHVCGTPVGSPLPKTTETETKAQ
ncbi:hypothetical protein [Flavobacterium wongokense]|uniref:hypothetical protein n=1 Tax=Flavobacterium wongokense TaxID=2910674 RepID=UPI001F436C3E|nr:hypothetical protein [Flavobacterium sp. WG47]MCF6130674.1 hypothetical protein [Flavobacterium sp. WG47]